MWTLDAMDHAARVAMTRCHCERRQFLGDPIESAWEGVALAVAADPGCSWIDAVTEGARVLAHDMWHQRHPASVGPRSAMFWGDLEREVMWRSRPELVINSLAIRQVLDALSEAHQVTLASFAAIGTVGECAVAWGISESSASKRITKARRAALNLWFGDEAPTAMVSSSTHGRLSRDRETCARGHDWSRHGKTRSGKPRRGSRRTLRICSECERLDARAKRAKQ